MGWLIIGDYKVTDAGKGVIRGRYDTGSIFFGESVDKDPFSSLLPTTAYGKPVYITSRLFGMLSEHDKTTARSRVYGIVTTFSEPCEANIVECFRDGCRALLPSDPCKDVSCPDKCVGVDKYDQVCQDGICVRGTLIETNSEHCGYTPDPTPDPTPTPSSDMYIIVALMLAGTYIILRR